MLAEELCILAVGEVDSMEERTGEVECFAEPGGAVLSSGEEACVSEGGVGDEESFECFKCDFVFCVRVSIGG